MNLPVYTLLSPEVLWLKTKDVSAIYNRLQCSIPHAGIDDESGV